MSQLSEPGCKACKEGASGVCTRHNEHGRAFFQQQKGEKMPTFDSRSQFKNIVIAEAQMAASDGQWATHVDRIMYAFDKLTGSSAASEERGLREALIEAGNAIHRNHAYLANTLRQCAHMDCCAVVKALDAAALQSVPSSPSHQIADVTIDAPKGIPGWIKQESRPEGCICSEAYGVGPEQCGKHGSPPPRACQEEQD